MKSTLLKAGMLSLMLSQLPIAVANQLQNPGFEDNPPASGWGNHINHSISPWVLGGGNASNVIKVDGGNAYRPNGQGPQADASGAAIGSVRHYLDIAAGSNDFYQSFTAKCTGKVDFGGYFSTRQNQSGRARVTLRKGSGFGGAIVGQSNQVNLPRGNSAKDPWRRVAYTASITAGEVYSLVISMDNNMNFDEAFVDFETQCDKPGGSVSGGPVLGQSPGSLAVSSIPAIPQSASDSCCPPINKQLIVKQLTPVFQPNGGSAANYRLNFDATPQFNSQMQAYVQYVHAMNPSIHTMSTTWRIYDKGVSNTANPPSSPGLGNMVSQFFTNFHYQQGASHGNMAAGYPLQPNRWYRVLTGTHFNNNKRFFPKKCETAQYWVNWRVQNNAVKPGGHAGTVVLSDGRKVLAKLPVRLNGSKARSFKQVKPLLKPSRIRQK